MANPKHVAIVRKGAAAIEKWRRNNRNGILNLIGADLHECQLSRANLAGANFLYASLALADLSGSNLAGAQLLGATLTAANLSDANLSRANLEYANLRFVELSHANLSESKLTSAVFFLLDTSRGTVSFKHAVMKSTAIISCDMNDFEGLETIKHKGPSHIDTDTLIISYVVAGMRFTKEIESFFLNAGVPKNLLDSLPEIIADIEYCNSFVCYGEPDKIFAERIVRDLKAKGAQCWIYPLDSTIGKRTWPEIDQKRGEAERVIVLCSAASLIREGVQKEIDKQINEDPEKMIPISLDNVWRQEGFTVKRGNRDLKQSLLDHNYADFCDLSKYDASLDRLLKGLKKNGKPSRKSKE